uniref:Nucleolar complex-associated protein 3 N-terminal domain-containing protein n=1 Tax=Arion vulgaris TaxID=1028688 RepID=A0A0B7AG73_9EUPU
MKMIKKAKTKAGSHKASLSKLANKRTNRLAKQGKLHKADKKKKKKTIQENYNKKQQKEQQQQQNAMVNDDVEEEEDNGLSDVDVQYFQRLKNANNFLKGNLSTESKPRSKKRKRTEEDEAEEYEQLPRTFAADKESQNMKMMLPIIAKGKVIKRVAEKDVAESREDIDQQLPVDKTSVPENEIEEAELTEPSVEKETESEKAYLATLSAAELLVYRKNKLAEKKQKIASLSNSVLEDPQNNMKKLKELRLMLGDTEPGLALTVRKYVMVSLMEVFKDIVPGYRLRIPTEKEKAQRVKKETKSLRDYEASFLLNYKIYLEFLETMAKVKPVQPKSFLTKHGIFDLNLPRTSMLEFGKLALKCFCEMLVNHPHFNYRNNIINSIVPFMNRKNSEKLLALLSKRFSKRTSLEISHWRLSETLAGW